MPHYSQTARCCTESFGMRLAQSRTLNPHTMMNCRHQSSLCLAGFFICSPTECIPPGTSIHRYCPAWQTNPWCPLDILCVSGIGLIPDPAIGHLILSASFASSAEVFVAAKDSATEPSAAQAASSFFGVFPSLSEGSEIIRPCQLIKGPRGSSTRLRMISYTAYWPLSSWPSFAGWASSAASEMILLCGSL